MMEIRQEIQRLGSSLYCHRNMTYTRVTAETVMQQAVQGLPITQRRALMQWLTQHGPYWEDARLHGPADWLQVNGEIVTDTAVGETAVCRSHGLARELVSFAPSDWNFNPVQATWVHDNNQTVDISVPNHWETATVTASLEAHPEEVSSWMNLGAQARRACTKLTFANNAFAPLEGHPFVPSAADRIRVLLWTLNKFKGCFDEQGQRNLALAPHIPDKSIGVDVTARCLNNLTNVELQRQSLEKAEEYHSQAASLEMKDDDRLTWKLSHIDLALARRSFPAAQSDLARLSVEEKPTFRIRWSTQARMARMYELMGNLREAEKWYRATIDTAVVSSAKLNHREYKTSVLSNFDFFSNYIEFLVRNNRPEQALQVAEIGRARALAAKLDPNLPQEETAAWLRKIQASLKQSGKVVLAYWESKTQLYVWLITATQVKFVQQPYGAHELEKLVIGYQNDIIEHSGVEGSPSSRRLYEILIQPFESMLPKGSHVVIVAHGNLYEINFESLIAPQPEAHYWIEDVWLENAISLGHIVNSSKNPVHYKKEILAIGAAIQVDPDFSPLPNAADEIQRVTRFFPPRQMQVFRAESATPQAFFTSNPEFYRYIHFVAHGTNITLEPMDSAIILSRGKDNSYKLYARDVANLKHPIHAEVVTISSCNSAGVLTNDLGGPVGLSSAFLHAGAQQVVAALWKVDDAATPQLMEQFYSELAKGKKASEALRDAKLSMLRNDKLHGVPFYWAPMQLYRGI
jgi:CHAT domain-containing protein